MKLRAKRFLLAIIVSVITLTSLLLGVVLDDEISFLKLTPFWIFVLCGSFCLWIFVLYIVLVLRKSEEYLQKTKKWDSLKRVGLLIILLWVVYGVLYYIRPYRWVLPYAICFSTVLISTAYMRNIYRKQMNI